jgi:putative sterol carrier protein
MSTKDAIERYMNSLPDAFRPQKAGGEQLTIHFSFTGPEGGEYVLTIEGGACDVRTGPAVEATIHVEADPRIFLDIQQGKIMANMAVSRGKMRLKGDLNKAFRLGTYFELPAGGKLSLL